MKSRNETSLTRWSERILEQGRPYSFFVCILLVGLVLRLIFHWQDLGDAVVAGSMLVLLGLVAQSVVNRE